MKARADGAYWDAERSSHLFHGKVAEVAKDHGHLLIGVETVEGAFDGVSLIDAAMGVMRGSRRVSGTEGLVTTPAAVPDAIPAGVDHDAVEPGIEVGGVAEPMVIAPGFDERVVGRIFSLLGVAEDEARQAVRGVEPLVDESPEGRGTGYPRVRPHGLLAVAQHSLPPGAARPSLVLTRHPRETFIRTPIDCRTMRRFLPASVAVAAFLAGCVSAPPSGGTGTAIPTGQLATPSTAASETPPGTPPPSVTPTPSIAPTATPTPAPNVYAGTRAGMFSPAVAGIPPRVFVPHEVSGTVMVIDPATFEIVDGFATGSIAHHVTPSWDMTRLYVNNMLSDTLTEIDAATGQVTGTVSVGRPYNLYFTPDGRYTIVVAEDLRRLDFFVRETWQLVQSVPIAYWGVDHLDFAADGSYLLASTEFDGWLVKVDIGTLQVSGELDLGGLPIDVKVSPDGSVFYVANQGRQGVSIVDPITMTELDFLPTGRGAHGLCVSRDTRSLYVSNRDEGTISVIDFAERAITGTWNVGASPDMLNVSPDGSQLWVSNRYHDTISVIDTADGSVISTIAVADAPHGLSYFPQPGAFSIGHNGVYR